MPIYHGASLRVRATVPPGDSLVGAYPLSMFRIERFHLPVASDLSLMHGGTAHPCDGKVHENQTHERTLCVGNFFAFHVRNQAQEPREFELQVTGTGVDGTPDHDAYVVLGTLAMESEHAPKGDWRDGSELAAGDDEELGLALGDYGDYSQADGKGSP